MKRNYRISFMRDGQINTLSIVKLRKPFIEEISGKEMMLVDIVLNTTKRQSILLDIKESKLLLVEDDIDYVKVHKHVMKQLREDIEWGF